MSKRISPRAFEKLPCKQLQCPSEESVPQRGRKASGLQRATSRSQATALGQDWVAVKELKLSYHNGYI